jgi:malate dehydrogenase
VTTAVVAIVGAGPLGGALTHRLARRDRVREIRLIDEAASVAAGKALDVQQAGAVEGFRCRIRSNGDLGAAVGASVIVLADPADATAPPWDGAGGESVVRRVTSISGQAPVVCAGAGHHALIAYAVGALGCSRRLVVGSAPGALAAALTARVALEANASPADAAIDIVGLPPDRAIVVWSAATIGRVPIGERLAPRRLADFERALPHLWPPGPYALASAAARAVEALTGSSRRLCSCYVRLESELGLGGRVVAVTARLARGGLESLVLPILSEYERVRLENAFTTR